MTAETPEAMSGAEPLAGLRVVDFSVTLPGPFCTQQLRRLGACVIQVEPPGGDPMREFAPGSFAAVSAGKESTRLDLKSEAGRERALALTSRADVVVEAWRPGVADRLGVGYAAVAARNPRVVYCSLSGYGQVGPLAGRPGHDINYLALAGAIDLMSSDGLPVGDLSAAMNAAVAILAALRVAERSGQGQHLDVSITGSLRDWVLAVGGADYEPFLRVYELPHYGTFETADGRILTLGIAYEDRLWRSLAMALGRPEWAELPTSERRRRSVEMRRFIADRVGAMSAAQVAELLGPVNTCWAFAVAPGEEPADVAPPGEEPVDVMATLEAIPEPEAIPARGPYAVPDRPGNEIV